MEFVFGFAVAFLLALHFGLKSRRRRPDDDDGS
jgi:hypothetical protein